MTNIDEPTPRADGGPAFPVVEPNHPTPITLRGMTLRDYFACCAMAGMVERVLWPPNPEKVAADAYKVADAMLVERSQRTTFNDTT